MSDARRPLTKRLGIPAVVRPVATSAPDGTDVFCREDVRDDWAGNAPLYETEHFAVMAPRFPLAPGHLLIVPRQHIAVFAEVPLAWFGELERLTTVVREFQRAEYGREAFIREQGSPVERQAVHHAHMHLVPVPFVPDVPAIEGGQRIGSWAAAAVASRRMSGYHYIEVGGERRIMPDDGEGVGTAEHLLCATLGSVWDPVKRQATKFTGPAGDAMAQETLARWARWAALHLPSTQRREVSLVA